MPRRIVAHSGRVTLLSQNEADTETPDNKKPVYDAEYIRSGGFVDGRPPDDLDKLATFSIAEVPLAGKILLGLGAILTLLLVVFLVVS